MGRAGPTGSRRTIWGRSVCPRCSPLRSDLVGNGRPARSSRPGPCPRPPRSRRRPRAGHGTSPCRRVLRAHPRARRRRPRRRGSAIMFTSIHGRPSGGGRDSAAIHRARSAAAIDSTAAGPRCRRNTTSAESMPETVVVPPAVAPGPSGREIHSHTHRFGAKSPGSPLPIHRVGPYGGRGSRGWGAGNRMVAGVLWPSWVRRLLENTGGRHPVSPALALYLASAPQFLRTEAPRAAHPGAPPRAPESP